MMFRLKDFRQSLHLFQSDMAEILQANQSTVSRMELRPAADLSYPQIQALTERFGEEKVREFIVTQESENPPQSVSQVVDNLVRSGDIATDCNLALQVIKEQSSLLSEVVRKNTEQNERLLTLLENLLPKVQ